MDNTFEKDIRELVGPILVVGAGGFIGANLFREIAAVRDDVYAGVNSLRNWRLDGADSSAIVRTNLRDIAMVEEALDRTMAKTIFYTASFGAYSFESDYSDIHEINYTAFLGFLELLSCRDISALIHAGSSSEYGLNAASPSEDATMKPNSHYAISKIGASAAISYFGTQRDLPVLNLRLYSVYGPYEDSARLIPVMLRQARKGEFPELANAEISHDFIYVRDAVQAFVRAANSINPSISGKSFNIGTGLKTNLIDLTEVVARNFDIQQKPKFGTYEQRKWDVTEWYADATAAKDFLGWSAQTDIATGLKLTADWQKNLYDEDSYWESSKATNIESARPSIAAIIACYQDAQAVPIMYERLVKVFTALDVDYQIIFVNDNSPDNTEEVIRGISREDPRVVGITHSRNFGSQMAFRSGMELAYTDACVCLDGDLQDPPELIEEFFEKWQSGYSVVYGVRVEREMSRFIHFFYKVFYYVFQALADFHMPRDAGDFSLIDRKVVRVILASHERDLFLRGLRAYVGFDQVGVNYKRPERMFGRSTNNWMKNIGWAKKALFSYSMQPINFLTSVGIGTLVLSIIAFIYVALITLIYGKAPSGIPTVLVTILFFGGLNMMGLAILGEYIGKILTEVKQRPPLIRKALIRNGRVDHDLRDIDRLPHE
jgi:dolichol-phosphate mannosyltransferase